MTYDQFWKESPELVVFYRKKMYLELNQKNQMLWLQGLYVFNAMAVTLNNAFGGKKESYIKEPVSLFPPTEREQIEERKRQQQVLIDELVKWQNNWNAVERNKHGVS